MDLVVPEMLTVPRRQTCWHVWRSKMITYLTGIAGFEPQ